MFAGLHVDDSSSEDEPVESTEEFSVEHQEWIEKVMKDEMHFTVFSCLIE